VYGPGAATEGNLVGRLIREHLRGELPGLIGAGRRWSYSYVEDVAAAHVEALTREGAHGEYIVGGENVPQLEVFRIVRDLTGHGLPRRLPFAVATAAALFEESGARLLGRPPRVTRGAVNIFRHDWSLDSGRSVVELSYRMTPLLTGLQKLLGHRGNTEETP
jgi:nucleoside-diphosphate-sugar epimerase